MIGEENQADPGRACLRSDFVWRTATHPTWSSERDTRPRDKSRSDAGNTTRTAFRYLNRRQSPCRRSQRCILSNASFAGSHNRLVYPCSALFAFCEARLLPPWKRERYIVTEDSVYGLQRGILAPASTFIHKGLVNM